MKLLLKLAVVAILANATYHVMIAYASHYKFADAVQQTTQFGGEISLDRLRDRVVELAAQYDLPIGEDDFTIRRQDAHTVVDGSYSRPIELFPGFTRPWTFNFHTDTLGTKPGGSSDRD